MVRGETKGPSRLELRRLLVKQHGVKSSGRQWIRLRKRLAREERERLAARGARR